MSWARTRGETIEDETSGDCIFVLRLLGPHRMSWARTRGETIKDEILGLHILKSESYHNVSSDEFYKFS